MADLQFQVTPETLKNTAGTISGIQGQFNATMEEIDTQMNSLRNVWDSEAANSFYAKFTKLKSSFADYEAVIKSYTMFLNQAAEAYGDSDLALNRKSAELFAK